MMHRHDSDVIIFGQFQQTHPQQRARGKIEGPGYFGDGLFAGLGFTFILGKITEIDHWQRDDQFRRNHLHRLPITTRKCCTQGFMPAYDLIQTLLQRSHIQLTSHTQRHRHVVKGAVGLQLIQEPEPLLGVRKRKIALAGDRFDGRGAQARLLPQG